MQRREEEWKEEKHRLKKEIQKKDEEIEDKDAKIATLKKNVDDMVALVPQILECKTPPRALHLKEKYLSFKLEIIVSGLNPFIDILDKFFNAYRIASPIIDLL